MALEFLWHLPTRGDGRYGDASVRRRGERSASDSTPLSGGVSDPRGTRFGYFDHLHQVARAAELSGFDGALIPDDTEGDDSWIVAGYLARGTRRLRLISTFEASWGSSVYAAKNAASFQRFTGGRFDWHLVEGGDPAERLRRADAAPPEDILPRVAEFLEVARGVLTEAPFSYRGRFFEVREGGFRDGLDHQRVPTVYFSGETPQALELSARHADVHVFSAQAVDELRPELDRLASLARPHGRAPRAGIRVDLLARETEEEALHDAHLFRSQLGPASVALEIRGAGLFRDLSRAHTGAAAVLVGSYEQVALALTAYGEAGIDSLLLGGVPHLEEAYRIGTHVLPLLRPRRTAKGPSSEHAALGGSL